MLTNPHQQRYVEEYAVSDGGESRELQLPLLVSKGVKGEKCLHRELRINHKNTVEGPTIQKYHAGNKVEKGMWTAIFNLFNPGLALYQLQFRK